MFSDNDLQFFNKHQITVAPPTPKQKLEDLYDIAHNPFLYLESRQRFLGIIFVKFPDEVRQLTYQDNHYLCFGKEDYNRSYFTIGEMDNLIYQIYEADDKLIILPINQNIKNFVCSYYYFFATIYELIAIDQLNVHDSDDCELYEQKADEFRQKIVAFDGYAFLDNEYCTYWQMLYEMLIDADLAFYLPSVSLMDYMNTGRMHNRD